VLYQAKRADPRRWEHPPSQAQNAGSNAIGKSADQNVWEKKKNHRLKEKKKWSRVRTQAGPQRGLDDAPPVQKEKSKSFLVSLSQVKN